MRFRTLNIPAFGPFTGFKADYGDGNPDLHLVFGHNEAGKSSLLRAITAVLYGIPTRSVDNFLHEYKNLSLSADIEKRDGTRLSFTRAKGNKNTIRDANGIALDDDVLKPFLGGVDEHYFDRVFGLDSDDLKQGADWLLSREGNLGQTLLATSTGGTVVQQTLDQFIERSEQYFKGRTRTNVSIRPAVANLNDVERSVRDHTIAPKRWAELKAQLSEKEDALQQLNNETDELDRKLDWIRRCQEAEPALAGLSQKQQQLQALPTLPTLPADFATRAGEARDAAVSHANELEREEKEVAQLTLRLQDCKTSPAVLAESSILEELNSARELYLSNTRTLSDLRSQLAAQKIQLNADMKLLGLTGTLQSLETLRVTQPERLAFDAAAQSLDTAQSALDNNREEIDDLCQQIKSDESSLAKVPAGASDALRLAVETASELRQQHRELPELESSIATLENQLNHSRALLPGVSVDGPALAALPLPTGATIRRYQQLLADHKRDINQQLELRTEQTEAHKSLTTKLQQLQRDGELPSLQSLTAARSERDAIWTDVLASWTAHGDSNSRDSNIALQQSYPAAVIVADHLADALREDAEQVAQAAQLQASVENCKRTIDEIDRRLEQLHSTQKETTQQWLSEWSECPLQVKSPDEMLEWREHWQEYRNHLQQKNNVEEQVQRIQQRVINVSTQLVDALGTTDTDDFDALYQRARRQISDRDKAIGAREKMQESINRQQLKLQQLETDTERLKRHADTATSDWEASCKALGLDTKTTVPNGRVLMDQRTESISRFDEWQKLHLKVTTIEKDTQTFEACVDDSSSRLGIEGDTTIARLDTLLETLEQARKAQDRHNNLTEQLQAAQNNVDSMALQAKQSKERFDQIKSSAQINADEALEPFLANLDKHSKLTEAIDTHHRLLSGLARSESVETFIERLKQEDSDLLKSRQSELERTLSQKHEHIQQLRDDTTELNRQRESLQHAEDIAADKSQQAASITAGLENDAREFIKMRLAAAFLEKQRDQYREQNQLPLLNTSSETFRAVTLGSFEKLVPEYDNRDEPVIAGQRPNGTLVQIDGMSEGTRDQLYLSMRMAALTQHMKNAEPMPLIMDDLLMTFDNQRSSAMLQTISELSKHTQIFLFTHHQHLIDLCHSELDKNLYRTHNL